MAQSATSQPNTPIRTATGESPPPVKKSVRVPPMTANARQIQNETVKGVKLTHPDRFLWPGITKHDLAAYWGAVAARALPGVAHAFRKTSAGGFSRISPKKSLAHVKITDRRGRILIDWLRNSLGATAVASFCPRAWDEVPPNLDLTAFTMHTLPQRLKTPHPDRWANFERARRPLPPPPAAASKLSVSARLCYI